MSEVIRSSGVTVSRELTDSFSTVRLWTRCVCNETHDIDRLLRRDISRGYALGNLKDWTLNEFWCTGER